MKFIASLVALLAAILVGIGAVVGYVANIIFLIKAASLAVSGQLVVSVVGIFLGPLGSLHGLGWVFGWW